jgi:hypothetical protein
MKRRISLVATAASLLAVFAVATPTTAHNRAEVWTPNGDCIQVGSLKSVWDPATGTYLDLYPADGGYPFDEFGTSFAASIGHSALVKGQCPS